MSALVPSGRDEELALERLIVADLERRAAELWAARRYADAMILRREARIARAHVDALEAD